MKRLIIFFLVVFFVGITTLADANSHRRHHRPDTVTVPPVEAYFPDQFSGIYLGLGASFLSLRASLDNIYFRSSPFLNVVLTVNQLAPVGPVGDWCRAPGYCAHPGCERSC